MATSSAILRMYGSSFVKGKFCQVDGSGVDMQQATKQTSCSFYWLQLLFALT